MSKEEAIKYLRQLYPNGGYTWLDEQRIEAIGMAIQALQEEPVKIKKGCKYRCLSDMVNKDTGNIAFIGDKIYLAPKDNTLVSEENGWLCDTSENASNFELVEEPVSEDLKEFEVEYIEREKDNIICVYDRHAGLVDGAKWQKENLMAKAIDAHCFGLQGTALFSFRLPASNYLVGSEVKVIVIKEE